MFRIIEKGSTDQILTHGPLPPIGTVLRRHAGTTIKTPETTAYEVVEHVWHLVGPDNRANTVPTVIVVEIED